MNKPVSIVPQSAGKGLGQQTGGNSYTDVVEATEILRLICNGGTGIRAKCEEALSQKEFTFLEEMIDRRNTMVDHLSVTGKQLFYLRDIKDKLIEAGVL